ncbi:MAG TPA: cell division protein FtsX, partial [Firmicutes bacterium]|nr:cell division protein FtsX [Bacillota bacterium]HCF92993.1 cell division protein FtsX [Bacillota bacterium]HCM18107.1 cell division protein FtsX [Bacillota bacterium]HCX71311.1 cell division protein FtsX [Bacillota bacterium]
MLFRKMQRDMRQNRAQFISIFLMSFLGVFIYAGINAEWFGLRTSVNRYYQETNLADVWVIGSDFTTADRDLLRANSAAIADVERRLTVNGTALLEGNPTLTLNFVEDNRISTSKVVAGADFAHDHNGLWLDRDFAEAHNLQIGDQLQMSLAGHTLTKEIRGLTIHPEYVYASTGNADIIPNHQQYGFAFMSEKAFPEMIPMPYNQLLLTTVSREYGPVEDLIAAELGFKSSVILTRESHSSYQMFDAEIEQHRAMGSVFPIAFLAIAVLTILTTMTRMVNNQRVQIGTLKAIGFRDRRILFHYVSYGLWLSLLGAVSGTLIGPLILPQIFFNLNKSMYVIPEWKAAIAPSIIVMAAVAVVLCTLAAFLPCRAVLKETAAQALRPKAPRALRRNRLEKTALWHKLGFNVQWNLRDIIRNKLRSIMALVGVAGCAMLLVCAFGLLDSIEDMTAWQYGEIYRFETKLMLAEDISAEQLQDLVVKYQATPILESAVEIIAGNIKETGTLLVSDETELIRYMDANRRYINLPDEGAALSYKMAKALGVDVGDTITWHIFGSSEWVNSEITAIHRTPVGQGLAMGRNGFEALGFGFDEMRPTAALTALKVADVDVSSDASTHAGT